MARAYKNKFYNKCSSKIEEFNKEMPKFVIKYIDSIKTSTTSNTQLNYLIDIKMFLNYILDADSKTNYSSINQITESDIERLDSDFINDYINYVSDYEKNNDRIKNENITLRRKLSSLRGLYEYLYTTNKIKANPITKVNLPKVGKKNIIRLENDESKRLKDSCLSTRNDKRNYTITSLLLGTGIRVSELVGLDITDVNINHNEIRVIRKGNKEDIVYMSDDLTEILNEYIEYRKHLHPTEEDENALFLSERGKRISVRMVEIMIKQSADSAGILKKITPHKLRSTFGTNLYQATSDLYVTAAALGHNSVETAKIYAELTEERKKAVRNMI